MDVPIRFLETDRVAPDTYVIRQLAGEGLNPVAIHLNTMVITGAEPVIVDSGPALTRAGWLERTFEVVEPEDVRWIFLSHDDPDHTGNLFEVLDRCPNATLVTNWFSFERTSTDRVFPAERMRWVNDEESFDVGDRELLAVLPPIFDGPTTRGLFDPKSGVFWGADSFGTAVPFEIDSVRELPPGAFREGFLAVQRMVSPWHRWLDPVRYHAHIDRVASLGATVVANAHGPTLHGDEIASAFELLRELPYLTPIDWPSQSDLEMMLKVISAAE